MLRRRVHACMRDCTGSASTQSYSAHMSTLSAQPHAHREEVWWTAGGIQQRGDGRLWIRLDELHSTWNGVTRAAPQLGPEYTTQERPCSDSATALQWLKAPLRRPSVSEVA